MDNETLKLIEDCRDLFRDINFHLDQRDRSKKLVEKQIYELNKILDNELPQD